ncbi:elongator complex protein 2 [Orussus abietinus]|uniref:elongator complex protein 2 n=1 Tax=Orussus abietinus TaxID=222816 RepID=UPI00062695D5|nr:elongator complex protein 2 [Orussus abietinus]
MTTRYISCACNRVPHSADWGRNGLICFGACNAVAIYDPDVNRHGKVLQTLQRHTGQVTVTRWIKQRDAKPEMEILSGSSDGTIVIWTRIDNVFKCTSVLNIDHAVTIANSLCIYEYYNDPVTHFAPLLICTGSISGDLKLWKRSKDGATVCFQKLHFDKKLTIEANLWLLPNGKIPILAVALEDSTIQLHCRNNTFDEEMNFEMVQILVGHEDWIRCMDFTNDNNGNVLMASGSQDGTIRLWIISKKFKENDDNLLTREQRIFWINDEKYTVSLESVFSSHEGWIYGIHWYPWNIIDGKYVQPMKLLSSSLDKTMIIWEPDAATGIWLDRVRVGDVGGNSLGFYGCKFSPNGLSIFGHGYEGSFHIWKCSSDAKDWFPRTALTGHFGEVIDLCWDPKGRFLITASKDQTTRIHAPWGGGSQETWHEIGRPQIHGYNMTCLVMLNPYVFASGAEEKVIRTFTAPMAFVNYLKQIAGVIDIKYTVAEGASVPVLGLTNKALFGEQKILEDDSILRYLKNLKYENPPTEEELVRYTLWPELQKLYGHGHEIFSMSARHDGSILATACKSASPEHSAIILWNTKTWYIHQKLISHQLTVTQMAFSPNDKYLLSVSRDRRWSLFQRDDDFYTLVVTSSKQRSFHSRVIWCCAWTPDSKLFATGSREGKIGVWNVLPDTLNNKDIQPVTNLNSKNDPVTALAFALLCYERNSYVMAIGFESGVIEIQRLLLMVDKLTWQKFQSYDCSQAHHAPVKRLMFRPLLESAPVIQLASCGADRIVKVYDIDFKESSRT